MEGSLYSSISNGSACRASREANAALIFNEGENNFGPLVALALDVKDRNHHKACWILELILEEEPFLLNPFLPRFCQTLPSFTHDGAVRTSSKISLFIAKYQEANPDFLDKESRALLIENAFDRLTASSTKVAPKAYLMRTLYTFGKTLDWIHPELRIILEKDWSLHSAAYKAAAREVLEKMERLKSALK